VGDDVIINSLKTRGCRWDSTPDAVIRLKHEGVSDRVITAMQNTGLHAAPAVVSGPAPVYYYPPPPPPVGGVVVVGPGYYGRRPYYYGRPYYRRW
jgi:2',3'-cyclic-nucleotide 2'-phosphodiesterase (5'-nucleotidase family)